MLAYQDMEYIEQVSCYSVSMSQPWGWATCLRRPAIDMHSLLCSRLCLRRSSGHTSQLTTQTGSRHASSRWGSSQSNCFKLGAV
jgi:hypothetical protein